jgi:4-amino-4-deoxy-L-arabinose transferase-like glycosyltransferase
MMLLVVGLCLISAGLGRFCFLLRPFDNDAAIFIYMGKMVGEGGRLCHDLIDNKFPTVGLMTSILYKAFGTCWPAYIALQATLSVATAGVLARTARRIAGSQAQLPTFLFAIVFLNFTTAVFGGFQLETIQVFFAVLAASAGIEVILTGNRADAFTAGLCAGCGMMFKPTAIGVLLAVALVMILRGVSSQKREDAKARRREENQHEVSESCYSIVSLLRVFVPSRLRVESDAMLSDSVALSFPCMFAGLCIPLMVALIYLTSSDLLRDMPALYRQISTYAHETVFDVVELIKPLTALMLLVFPIAIRGVICRRQRDPNADWPSASIAIFLLIWLAIETAGVILQRRMYAYHFLPMVPPAALLFGLIPRFNRPGILMGSIGPIALLSITASANLISTTRPGEDRLPLSDYLAAHAKPGDAVWMDAWPRIVLETGLRPGARLPFTFLFTNYDDAGLDYSAGMIADFDRIKPAYIILPVPLDRRLQYQIDFIPELNRRPIRQQNYLAGWRRIEQYTLEHYTKETMVGNDAVYHRRTP